MAVRSDDLLPGEKNTLIEDAEDLLGDQAQQWLDTENVRFGGKTPREMIESGDPRNQQFVRDLLRAARYGVFS